MQGRRYARLMMRESEGEKAVHAYNVTAHVLYKGMENLSMVVVILALF